MSDDGQDPDKIINVVFPEDADKNDGNSTPEQGRIRSPLAQNEERLKEQQSNSAKDPTPQVAFNSQFTKIRYREVQSPFPWGTFRKFMLVVVLLGLSSIAFYEPFNRQVIDKSKQFYSMLSTKLSFLPQLDADYLKPSVQTRSKAVRRDPGFVKELLNKKWNQIKCRKVLEQFLLPGAKSALQIRFDIIAAQCFTLAGQPQRALKIINSLRNIPVGRMGERVAYTRVISRVLAWDSRQGKIEARLNCKQWQVSPDCLARVFHSASQLGNNQMEGAKLFASNIGKLSPEGKSFYWLAMARRYRFTGRFSSAVRALKRAQVLATKEGKSLLLVREILDEGIRINFRYSQLRERQILKWDKSFFEVLPKAEHARSALLEAIFSKANLNSLNRVLAFESQLAFHPAFLNQFGIMSFAHGNEEKFLKYLNKMRIRLEDRFKLALGARGPIDIWEIRSHLALGHYRQAFRLVSKYQKQFTADLVSLHLQGVALMGISKVADYQLLAVKKFRKALSKQENWESSAAIGLALVEAGKNREALKVVGRMIKKREKNYQLWSQLIQGEIANRQGNTKLAKKLVQKAKKLSPQAISVRLLNLQLLKEIGSPDFGKATKQFGREYLIEGLWRSRALVGLPTGPLAMMTY